MLFAEFISPARQAVMRMSVKPTPINGPLHDLNAKLRGDERIALSLLPVADGMTLAMKL
jgi:hypothetical protein